MAEKRVCLSKIIIGVLLLLTPAVGHAFDGADVLKLKTTKRCRSCDLAAAELAGLNLTSADLSGANLTAANLSSSDLTGAYLVNVNLTGANLAGANLTGANLLDANIRGAALNGTKLGGAVWTDGRICARESVGICR